MPATSPPDAVAAGREGLGSALAAAEALPAELRGQLVEPAREAFTAGLNVAGGLGAVLLAVLAVAAVTLVRPEGRPG